MDVRQYFVMAVKNLQANKLRFAQTMLGLVIGVAAVTAILIVQQGMVNSINAMYQEYSPSLMFMATYRPADSSKEFMPEDMEKLAAANPEYIKGVSPFNFVPGGMKRGDQVFDELGVMGVNEQFLDMSPVLHLAEGRFLQPMDIDREQNVCVVGNLVAQEVFAGEALGQTLRIQGYDYTVVGVLADVVDDSEQFNGVAYIPYSNAKKMTTSQPFTWNGVDYYVASYYVNANGMENIPNARETVYTALEEVWGDNCMFQSFSFRYKRESELTAVDDMAKKMLAAAGVVLLVGGVGIMNVLLAAVAERKPEIGLRKAFGARRQDIRWQFIIEAASTSLIGGLIGIILGIIASIVACQTLMLPVKMQGLPLLPILAAFTVTVAVGLIFGAYPAAKAAKMEIVQALRPE